MTDYPDGTGPDWRIFGEGAASWLVCVRAALEQSTQPRAVYRNGDLEVLPPTGPSWLLLALEAIFTAMVETDPQKLRGELDRAAAVLDQWTEAINRREDP